MSKLLKMGDTGYEVAELQQMLLVAGVPIKVDAVFGPQTERVVKAFQVLHGLKEDGIVGPVTWGKIVQIATKQPQVAQPRLAVVPQTPTESQIQALSEPFTIEMAAEYLNVEVEAIQAVSEVESSGEGFNSDGSPKILFEGHVFWGRLRDKGMFPEVVLSQNPPLVEVLYPGWTKRYYRGGVAEYDRLGMAEAIDKDAALESCSWGAYQIMGYHWKSLGYESVEHFVRCMWDNEGEHLKAFVLYIGKNKLRDSIARHEWDNFARRYNGPGYRVNQYHTKIAEAYRRLKQ